MKLLKSRESGQTMVMALILLAVGSLLVVPMLNQSFTNLGYHQSIECRTLTSYSADAGVEYVSCKLYNAPGAYTEEDLNESFILNDRTVNVTAHYESGGVYKITSVASSGGCGSTTIEAYANLGAGSFAFVIAAKDYMELKNITVDSAPDPGQANILSNGDIVLGSVVSVNGDAFAVGTISGWEGKVTGTVTEGSAEVTFPGDYSQLYKAMAQEGGTIGSLTITEDRDLGPVYIDGDLDVNPNVIVTLTGTGYVAGVITTNISRVEGSENIAAEVKIRLVGGGLTSEIVPIVTCVYGDIEVVGGTEGGIKAVLYAPNGVVSITNVDYFHGAVGGKTVLLTNVDELLYAQELHGRQDLPGGELATISYSYK